MLPIHPIDPTNPAQRRRAPRNFNSPQPSDPVSEQKRACAALDAMQRSRPLKPPHLRGKP